MKRILNSVVLGLSAMLVCCGCVGLSFGGGTKTETQKATVGQQLIDLKNAKEAGAISDAEYEAQKAKLLQH